MKKIILLLSTLFSFSFFLTAQSIDKALEQLETVRLQNGEQSQEYLSALDTVILKANLTGEKTTAFTYRKQHLDIVKQMKGERCVEVADDLWRLGNTSCMLGDTMAGLDYYTQAAEVFEKSIDLKKNYDYIQHYDACLFYILQILASNKDLDGLAYYSTKFKKLSEKTEGTHSCSHLENLLTISSFNNIAGNKDNALSYCTELVNNCSIIDSCNYRCVDIAYGFIESYYYYSGQNDRQIAFAIEHLNKLESADNDFFDEIIHTLQYLMISDVKDVEAAIGYGKHAEQMLYESQHSKQALYQDSAFCNIVSNLALLYDITHDYVNGLSYHQLICEIKEYNGTDNTIDYYKAVLDYFDCANEAGESQLVMNLGNKVEPLIFKYSDSPMQDAYNYALNMFNATSSLGQYKDALHYCDELLGLSIQLHGDSCWIDQADVLLSKAEICMNMGAMQDAQEYLSQCKSKLRMVPSTMESDYSKFVWHKVFNIEGQMLSDYEEAIMKFDSAILICDKLINEAKTQLPDSDLNSISLSYDNDSYVQADIVITIGRIKEAQNCYANTLVNKGLLLLKHGAINDSYNCFIKASAITENLKSNTSIAYLTCQNNVAMCLMNMGRYSDAINILDNNMQIVKNVYGTNHPLYPICLQNYAVYYFSIGNNQKAHEYLIEAASYGKSIFGENSERYAQALMNIGASYFSLGNYSEAYSYLKEAQSIYENTRVTPDALCLLYRNLSGILIGLGQKEEGALYFNKAKELTEATWGKYSVEFAEMLAGYGWMLDDYEKAFDYFLEASSILLTIGYTHHPSCIRSLICYGSTGILLEKPLASDYIQITAEAVKDYYRNNLSYYIGDDRSFVWQYLFGVKNTLFSARTDNYSDLYLFNYILFSKSLMLSTSDSFKKAILAMGQQHLIDQFNDIQALQRAIDNQSFSLSVENQPLEQLYDRKNSMERKLLAEMKSLGYSINDSITYNDIRKSLKDNEIAIEFVDYYHLREKKTYYLALLAKSSWENPIYVLLCTEDELKNRIVNPNVTYSTDDLYRMLWQPLLEYVGDSRTVYFSPSGMLHTIALESVYTSEGSCLSDKYNLVRLTSMRELCKAKQPKTYETGAIYGGLQYDVEQQRMAEVAAMNKTELEQGSAFALRGDDRGNWNYLSGTLAEAEHIAGIMRQANIGCGLYEGDMGSEESFKALSGGNTDIIHLATHGYFIEGEKADMNDFMNSLSPLAKQETDSIIDPLLRSGLILSGGNNAWLGKEVPEGIEDGVLTALEISTMNLSGTDMVVMSACETGLGDITGDGVFGLQRAFKMAGVQTLVMSLWKVDDNATSLMMQTFYEHLLSGITKREAFRLAQAAVKAKYPEPYYWAGFIMLD